MRAKFLCTSVTKYRTLAQNGEVAWEQEEAKMSAVFADGQPENNEFNRASPNGDLRIGIDNPAAFGFIQPGKSYYIDFTPAN